MTCTQTEGIRCIWLFLEGGQVAPAVSPEELEDISRPGQRLIMSKHETNA